MAKPVAVRALPGHRLWLRFDDGAEGEVDLSELAGRGVFRAWEQPAFFETVTIDEHGAVCWGSNIDLCPDSLYMQLTGKSPDEIFPGLRNANA